MDCRAFEGWLDAGRPDSARSEAATHATACPACAAAAEAADRLDHALGGRLGVAGPDFTRRVLARLDAAPLDERAAAIDAELLLPWWTQILREPAALLGLGLGVLCAATTASGWSPAQAVGGAAQLWTTAWIAAERMPTLLLAGMGLPLLAATAWGVFRLTTAAFTRLGDLVS